MLFSPIILSFCLSTVLIHYFFNVMFLYLLIVFFLIIYYFDTSKLLDNLFIDSLELSEEHKLEILYLEILYLLSFIKGLQLLYSRIEIYAFFRKTFICFSKNLIALSNYINNISENILIISFFHLHISPIIPYNLHKYHYIYTNDSLSFNISNEILTDFHSDWELSNRCIKLDTNDFEMSN